MLNQAGRAPAAGEIFITETFRSEILGLPWKWDKLQWQNSFLCAMCEDSALASESAIALRKGEPIVHHVLWD